MYGNISEYYAKERINNHLKAAEAHRLAKLATNNNGRSFKVGSVPQWLLSVLTSAVETAKNLKVNRSSPFYPKA